MKTSTNITDLFKRAVKKERILAVAILFSFMFTSCQEKVKTSTSESYSEELALKENSSEVTAKKNIVEVSTKQMEFIMPEELQSGWTTFRYNNESPMVHFFVLEKMPMFEGEQKQLEDTKSEIVPIFQAAMDLINDGQPEEGFAQFANFPEWFSQVEFSGGVGLLSPGETAETTVYLEPGVYLVECYVKTNGIFHSATGMLKQITVTEEASETAAPSATLEINISSANGIEAEEVTRPGKHSFAVNFKDQQVYGNGLQHDVHLVKLEDGAEIEELENWINWSAPTGMETPAPENITFLGGAQEMPAGNTAYFELVLKPGNYAWIAEVPNAGAANMLKTFSIPEQGGPASK